MTIFLLMLIVAILLFGATVIRGVIQYILIAAAGLLIGVPILFWLVKNPNYLWAIVAFALVGLFWRIQSDDQIEQNEKQELWNRYSHSIENNFIDEERAEVKRLWNSGQMREFEATCERFAKPAEYRAMSKRQKKAHRSYLKSQYKKVSEGPKGSR